MAEEKTAKRCIEVSKKNRAVAMLLCMLFGWLGLHRFYVNKHGTALAEMFTIGGFGLWYFIDFVMIAAGTFEDKEGKAVIDWF